MPEQLTVVFFLGVVRGDSISALCQNSYIVRGLWESDSEGRFDLLYTLFQELVEEKIEAATELEVSERRSREESIQEVVREEVEKGGKALMVRLREFKEKLGKPS